MACKAFYPRESWATFQTGDELYLPRTTLDLQFQAEGSNNFGPLAATVIRCFKPFTSAAVLLIQRHSDNGKVILKLADRRLGHRSGKGGPVPWSLSLEGYLRHAVRDVQDGVAPNWFELIRDDENWPDIEFWEDWMWEVSTWCYKLSNHNTELAAYRLLRRLQGRYIPRLFGVVRLCLTPDSTTLHPITDVVQGLVFEYIPGISMSKLKPGIGVSEQEAERISSQVMEALRAIEAENYCVLTMTSTSGTSFSGKRADLQSSPTLDKRDIREPELSDEEWWSAVRGAPDTHYMRRLPVNPENGPWKRTLTPYEMSNPHYKVPSVFNRYVKGMPEDFRRETFERVFDTDWEGAREKVYQWRIRPGVRCRPRYDYD